MADSTIRLRQLNQAELSGFAVQIVQSVLSNLNVSIPSTGNYYNVFYPLNQNPNGYLTSGMAVSASDLSSAITQITSYVNQTFYPNSNPSGFYSSNNFNSIGFLPDTSSSGLGQNSFAIFTGNSGSFSMPSVAQNVGKFFYVKNRGSGVINLVCGGGDNFYSNHPTGSFSVNTGEGHTFANDGSYWNVMS